MGVPNPKSGWYGVPLPTGSYLNELINAGPNGLAVRAWHAALGAPEVATFIVGVTWLEEHRYIVRHTDRAYATLQSTGAARGWLIGLTVHPEDPLIGTILGATHDDLHPRRI